MAASAIHKIKHKACSQDANKARGKAKCFIGHQGSARRVLYFMYYSKARPCFNCFKGFTHGNS